MHPSENPDCYASPAQRAILSQLADHPVIHERFFLTGGTALSVFYLYHRTSDDLDLFTVDNVELSEISFWLKTVWRAEYTTVRTSLTFLSALIGEVKVDFVIDTLSEGSERNRVTIGQKSIMIDTPRNIATNKLCTIVSRTEPKDFVDLFFLLREVPELDFESLFQMARKREALLDDPPTAAYQVENSMRFIRERPELFPRLKKPFDLTEMIVFYESITKKLYEKGRE